MANYVCAARTNYFRVKNDEAFKRAARHVPGMDSISRTATDGTVYRGLLFEDGIPSSVFDPETDDEDADFDIGSFLSEHLADDEVAIVMEVGYERLRFLNGYALAINNRGERREISLADIYDCARGLNGGKVPINPAEY